MKCMNEKGNWIEQSRRRLSWLCYWCCSIWSKRLKQEVLGWNKLTHGVINIGSRWKEKLLVKCNKRQRQNVYMKILTLTFSHTKMWFRLSETMKSTAKLKEQKREKRSARWKSKGRQLFLSGDHYTLTTS